MTQFGRREFLKLSALVGASALLQACRVDLGGGDYEGKRVIVIGAGMSGLAAAHELQSRGIEVIVLEARERMGGRIWTNNDLGLPIDLGASWIHGPRNNPITKLADEFNASRVVTDEDEGWLYGLAGAEISDSKIGNYGEQFEELLEEAMAWAEDQDHDVSAAAAVQTVVAQYDMDEEELMALNWALRSLENSAGVDMGGLSMWYGDEDEEFSGDDVLFPGGYHQLIAGLATYLDVRLGQVVQQIDYGDGVIVTTNSDAFNADAVVVTLPLGVLKAGAVGFTPSLPQAKQMAISDAGFGVLNKIVLRFPSVFWPREASYLEFFTPRDALIQEFLNLSEVADEPLLMAFVGGSRGDAIENRSESAIVAEAMGLLRKAYGDNIPEPTGVLISNWRADQYARGSYSHIPVGQVFPDVNAALAKPVDDVVFFAGEATSTEYPATVHGAYLSGIVAAEAVAWELG